MSVLNNLKPEGVFKFFEAISEIPRGSGDEKRVSDYLARFAVERNLFYHRDETLNVLIKKPGSAGFETSPPVMLQGHMDMVCEKNSGTAHDFLNDPIKLIKEGDLIKADGTTLGADNGIACAIMLALLDSDKTAHPPLEAVFTTNEEIGLEGAAAFDAGKLSATRMINLDGGREGIFTVSCAGGIKTSVTFEAEKTPAPDGSVFLRIDIKGLSGGHSGSEIHLGKANANVLMGRLLCGLYDKYGVSLAEIGGGMKDNAIPRESYAVIAVRGSDAAGVENEILSFEKIFKDEYSNTDPSLGAACARVPQARAVFPDETGRNVAAAILLTPNGVLAMDKNIAGLVETSSNLGVITTEGSKIILTNALRSSVPSRKKLTEAKIFALAGRLGAKAESASDYPSWAYDENSELRKIFVETYTGLYGKEPIVRGLHAGLECGVFGGKMPGLDMIACGPDAYGAHTPDESLSISSTARFWEFIVEVLGRLK